jgi:hypothetical protein
MAKKVTTFHSRQGHRKKNGKGNLNLLPHGISSIGSPSCGKNTQIFLNPEKLRKLLIGLLKMEQKRVMLKYVVQVNYRKITTRHTMAVLTCS